MKKIAILRCQEVSQRCTGSGCLKAWNNKDKAFAPYAEEDVTLAAFLNCNGCRKDPAVDEGMLKKLDRLQKMGVEIVHTSGCTMKDRENQVYCVNIEKIVGMLHERGIQTVHGTHK